MKKQIFLALGGMLVAGIVWSAGFSPGPTRAIKEKTKELDKIEAVSAPTPPTGPASLAIGQSGTYSTGEFYFYDDNYCHCDTWL